jgi:peptidoglycan/xylan/chitin deacetylase (PgdA/CDA1 family)
LVNNHAPAPSSREVTDRRHSGGAQALATLGTVGLLRPRCVLAYHEIVPSTSRYLYGVSAAQFEEHTMQLASSAASKLSATPAVEITFDDGHRSNFEVALPLLDRAGLRATFFVLAGSLGSSDQFMTWEHVRQLTAAGHSVQSHGWSHRLLTQCDERELADELVRSRTTLEDGLGVAVTSISAPGGRWDDRVATACARAGYTHLFHSNPWARPSDLHGVHIQGRHMVIGNKNFKQLRKELQAGWPTRAYHRAAYGLKERARSVLGDSTYHRLWCWIANYDPETGTEVLVAENGSPKRRENP